jgi:hypothetical protein
VRTTLTIDDDIAVLVDQKVRRSGGSLKGTVNRLLRLGIIADEQNETPAPFVVEPLFMGVRPGQNYENIEELLEELEGPYHR